MSVFLSIFQFNGIIHLGSFFSSASATIFNEISNFVSGLLRSISSTNRERGVNNLEQRITELPSASPYISNILTEKELLSLLNYEPLLTEVDEQPFDRSNILVEIARIKKERIPPSSDLDNLIDQYISSIKSESNDLMPFLDKIKLLNKHKKFILKIKHELSTVNNKSCKLFKNINSKIIKLKSELETMLLETTQAAFSRFYSYLLNSSPSLDPQFKGGTVPSEIDHLKNIIEYFIKTIDDAEQIEALQQCCAAFEAIKENSNFETMYKNISLMKIKSSYLIPVVSVDHAFIYEIIRKTNDEYFLTIINTGDQIGRTIANDSNGKLFHPLFADKGYIIKSSDLDVDYLNSILHSSTTNLSTFKVLEKVNKALTERGAIPQEGAIHHAQLRGNCYVKCFNRYVFGLLNRLLGEDKGRALYKKFKVFRTKIELETIKQVLDNSDEETLKKAYKINSIWGKKYGNKKLNAKKETMLEAANKVLDKRKMKAKLPVQKNAQNEYDPLNFVAWA